MPEIPVLQIFFSKNLFDKSVKNMSVSTNDSIYPSIFPSHTATLFYIIDRWWVRDVLVFSLIILSIRSSLDRLQIDQIGIAQLHWSTANYAPFQDRALWDGLVAMYDKGLVRAVGVSNYGPKQLLKIHDYLKERGVPLSTAQVQFSLLSMGEDQVEIKAICDSLGIRVISYSPLGLGMLTGKYTPSNLPRGPRSLLFRQIIPGIEPLIISLKEIAQKRGKTIPQVAINWCISKGTIPIPGVKSVKQAEENLGALGWKLGASELDQLEYAAHESPGKMIQNVFQTR